MANYKGTDTDLTALANAIRAKNEIQDSLEWPKDFIKYIKKIGVVLPASASFSSATPEDIVTVIQAAHNGIVDLREDYGWAVGDTRTISISSFTANNIEFSAQDIDIVITSFDEYMSSGNVLQFDFKSVMAETVPIGSSDSNDGGYEIMIMKTTILPALVNALPIWLKNLLIEFSCKCATKGDGGTVKSVTGNKLAIRSATEMGDDTFYEEGVVIPYYQTQANRVKMDKNDYAQKYWTRSPISGSWSYMIYVDTQGRFQQTVPPNNGNQRIAPFGCL